MTRLSNLPPGVTDRMIEEQQGTDDDAYDHPDFEGECDDPNCPIHGDDGKAEPDPGPDDFFDSGVPR